MTRQVFGPDIVFSCPAHTYLVYAVSGEVRLTEERGRDLARGRCHSLRGLQGRSSRALHGPIDTGTGVRTP